MSPDRLRGAAAWAGAPDEPPAPFQLDLLREARAAGRPLRIPIPGSDGRPVGHLAALTRADAEDDATVERFVRWRNRDRSGWLDRRPVTFEGTRRWALAAAEAPDRLAFLIHADGRPVGRCGLVGLTRWWSESDGLVRGESGGGLMFMLRAQAAALRWQFEALDHRAYLAKILSSNDAALNNCRSLGHAERPVAERPVYREAHPEGDVLRETGDEAERLPGVSLCYFVITREGFQRGHREWYKRP